MSLTVLTTEKSPLLEISQFITGGIFGVASDQEMLQSQATVRRGDIFATIVSGSLRVSRTRMPVGLAFGIKGYLDETPRSSSISRRPNTRKYDSYYDSLVYGYSSLQRARRALIGSINPTAFPSVVDENLTRHNGLSGSLVPKMTDSTWTPSNLALPIASFTGVPRLNSRKDAMTILSLGPLYPRYDTRASNDVWDLIHVFQYLENIGSFSTNTYLGMDQYGNSAFTHSWKTTTSNFRYFPKSDGSFIVTYHSVCVDYTIGVTWSWDSCWKHPAITPTGSLYNAVVGQQYLCWNGEPAKVDFSYSNYTTSSSIRAGPSEFRRVTSTPVKNTITSFPVSHLLTDFGKVWAGGISGSPHLNLLDQSFTDQVNENWGHLLASTTFSTADAISRMEGSDGINPLQTLAKIPDIAKSLPKVSEAVSILGRLVKKDLSLSTIRDILDLSTSTFLQGNFSWQPYYLLLRDWLPRAGELLPLMFDEKHLTIGYGTFSFQILNDLGRESCQLLTRTKVTVDISLSGLMSASLNLDALGLLPRPSRLWDLIPFTFVVNWFTGAGRMLNRAETIGISMIVPAMFVHTLAITSPLTADELDTLGVSSIGDPPACLRAYYRDVSLYTPEPRYSRFPFGVPTSLPSSGIIGSLLYQLFLKG